MMGGSIIFQTTLNVVAKLFYFYASRYLSIGSPGPCIVQICSHNPKLVKYGIRG
jgi:hypothetical protein